MWLTELEADRLRNLRSVALPLDAGLTLIVGRNGQGKTSLLEAVYLLGTGRSFRTRRMDELVAWQGGPLRVAGRLAGRRGRSELKVLLHEGARSLLVDDRPQELEGFLGHLDLVDLTAGRMAVLRGGPEERRRFLDRGVVGLRPSYLRFLGEYRRVLQQRNALLRSRGAGRAPSFEAELEAWDRRLIPAAAELHRSRREYAVGLASRLGATSRSLFPSGGELTLRYRPSPAATAEAVSREFPTIFEESLTRGRRRDRALGHTCRGPHRDELIVELDGIDLRRFGSAGQVRGAMIALKLGKLALLQEERGEVPLFLMDDFDSDLDEVRAAALADHLRRGGFQALVATSKEKMAERFDVSFAKVLVDEGRVRSA